MLMAMSNAENWLDHTKSEHFFFLNGRRAQSACLENCRCARAMDIFKKISGFSTETLW